MPRVFLFLAFALSLCYFPQLFAEVSCSGHSTVLVPSVLFILSCSSSLDDQVPPVRGRARSCAMAARACWFVCKGRRTFDLAVHRQCCDPASRHFLVTDDPRSARTPSGL